MIFRKIKSIIRHPYKFYKAMKYNSSSESNIKRWEDISNLQEEWDERTIMMAKLIPENASVLEFGAARMVLPKYIPDTCSYTASDIVARDEQTIVCDLNKTFPSLNKEYTHIVFSGVLEYIFNLNALVENLSNLDSSILISYATIDKTPDYVTRKQSGWVNHYSENEIMEIFLNREYQLSQSFMWKLQTIYVFTKH